MVHYKEVGNWTMAMQKNMQKRNEILNCAYKLISEAEYGKVFLHDIAEKANINKSLLQHYYARKSDIIENILNDMLTLSFKYIEYIEENLHINESMHLRLSVYTALFWETASKHERLNKFILNIIPERELLNIWINIVYKWLYGIEENSGNLFPVDKLKIALAFAMAGGLELYLHHDELNVEVMFICEQITTSFMKVLDNREEDIQEILNKTRLILKQLDIEKFYEYCNNQIEWFYHD